MCHETLRKVDATSQTEEPLPTPVVRNCIPRFNLN